MLLHLLMKSLCTLIGSGLAVVESSYVQPPGDNRGPATSLLDLPIAHGQHRVLQDGSESGHHSDCADSW